MKVKPLSSLEQQVMEIVWALRRCTIRDVIARLPPDRPLAYTTIATIMNRMVTKGTLQKCITSGTSTYTPRVTKHTVVKTEAASFLKKFFQSYGDAAIASFAESIEQLPPEKKRHLLELLTSYEKQHS